MYREEFMKCTESCSGKPVGCLETCTDTYASNLETCPCQPKCLDGCPCEEYSCIEPTPQPTPEPVEQRLLVLDTYTGIHADLFDWTNAADTIKDLTPSFQYDSESEVHQAVLKSRHVHYY